ncbi:hypothetical protein G6F40_015714 [Rhizopus arrhizus]|nr:hypothetical protein G6F40_015714 [Rhizopus arrhizus]
MFAHGRIGLPHRPDVITVPETAVSYSAYGDSVYVLTPTAADQQGAAPTVRQAYVKTAERGRGRVVVTEGLEAGDQVVTSGQLRLHNGAAVAIIAADTVALGDAPQAMAQAR